MRKIYIPFKRFTKNIGGPATFMRNLKNELDNSRYLYQNSPLLAKGIFFPIAYNKNIIRMIKLMGGKVIQRLDGIYYPSKHSDKYKENNYKMEYIYKNYSDHIIFQSEYSKQQVFNMFGEIPKDKYSIIFNGANTDIFYPAKGKALNSKVKFITTGNFRNKEMIMPVIKALDILDKEKYNFEFMIYGPISLQNKAEILQRKYVKTTQSNSQNDIAQALRKSDIFIYSHLNPPCPNSVIEAVSCGLPIVGFNSGAMKELCFFNSELLADVNNDIFQVYEDFCYETLYEKLELAISNFSVYKSQSLKNNKNFSMKKCAKEYTKTFDKVTDK